MTYSDWREDLSEGKRRIFFQAMQKLGKLGSKVVKKTGEKLTRDIGSLGATKASGRFKNITMTPFGPVDSRVYRDFPGINTRKLVSGGTYKQNRNPALADAIKSKTKYYNDLDDYENILKKQRGELEAQGITNKNILPNQNPKTDPTRKPKAYRGKQKQDTTVKATEQDKREIYKSPEQKRIDAEPSKEVRDKIRQNLPNNKKNPKKPNMPKYYQAYAKWMQGGKKGNKPNLEDFFEQAMVAPTNNIGDGKIAGTVEAGDNPPIKKKKGKKKRYIYGGRGSRKNWMA